MDIEWSIRVPGCPFEASTDCSFEMEAHPKVSGTRHSVGSVGRIGVATGYYARVVVERRYNLRSVGGLLEPSTA